MLNIEFASSLGQGLWQFVSYMGLAIFAENVILARALGVTRLMKLVPDHKAQVWDLCLPLIWVMTLSAPLGWAAHNLLFPWLRSRLPAWLPISALRPVVYLTCGVAAMAVTWLVLGLLPRKMRQSCRSQLSLATCSTVMLGTLLPTRITRWSNPSRLVWAAAWATPSSSSSCVKAAAACAVRRCPQSFRACPVP